MEVNQAGGLPESRGSQAESLRWILEKANSPEIHEQIREAVQMMNDATDPTWRELIQGAAVSLYGGPEGSITLLPSTTNPALDRDIAELGDEAFQLLTSAGRVEVVVSFAQDILASPANIKALDQMSRTLGRAGLAGVSPATTILIVLAWLTAFGLPLAIADLPAKDQGMISNEIATVP